MAPSSSKNTIVTYSSNAVDGLGTLRVTYFSIARKSYIVVFAAPSTKSRANSSPQLLPSVMCFHTSIVNHVRRQRWSHAASCSDGNLLVQ